MSALAVRDASVALLVLASLSACRPVESKGSAPEPELAPPSGRVDVEVSCDFHGRWFEMTPRVGRNDQRTLERQSAHTVTLHVSAGQTVGVFCRPMTVRDGFAQCLVTSGGHTLDYAHVQAGPVACSAVIPSADTPWA